MSKNTFINAKLFEGVNVVYFENFKLIQDEASCYGNVILFIADVSFHFLLSSHMEVMKLKSHTIHDLAGAARQLLEFATGKKVFAFTGSMGSGKTTFIKAICRELGVHDVVSSPTFALVNEYIAGDGNLVYHFDFYRIKNEQEAMEIGCEEYFYSGHFCFVEWSEKILNLLPKEIVQVMIEVENETRLITFQR